MHSVRQRTLLALWAGLGVGLGACPMATAEVVDAYFGMNYVTATAQVREIQLLEITYIGGSGQATLVMPAFPGVSPRDGAPFKGLPDAVGIAATPTYTTTEGGDGESTRTIGQPLSIDWDTSGAFPKIEITDIRVDVTWIGEWSASFETPYVVGLVPPPAVTTSTEMASVLLAPQGDLYDGLRGAPGNSPLRVIATASPPGYESYIGSAFGEFIFAAAAVGGELWRAHDTGTDVALFDVWGAAPDDVYVVGDAGTILHYAQGAWSSQDSGTQARLRSVWGSGPGDVFAVGDDGTILRNDGSGWAAQPSGTTASLLGVWGSGSSNVFAVGTENGSGIALHYDGNAWSQAASFPTGSLLGVWVADQSNVYVVGFGGTRPVASGGIIYEIPVDSVFSSNDGGASWAPLFDVWYDDLSSLWGSGASELFAAGGNFTNGTHYGVIYHHDGAGLESVLPPTPELASAAIRDIWATPAGELFAVGYFGAILHRHGTSWTNEASGTTQMLNGVWGACPADVFAVGGNGTILQRKRALASCLPPRLPFRHPMPIPPRP